MSTRYIVVLLALLLSGCESADMFMLKHKQLCTDAGGRYTLTFSVGVFRSVSATCDLAVLKQNVDEVMP